MAKSNLDLAQLFGAVTGTMNENRESLNASDSYNHDHGDHMVEIFEVITQAMKDKKDVSAADQLEYASQLLRKKSHSGSADLYANGLSSAAGQFLGKDVTPDNAILLVNALMGGSQKKAPSKPTGLLGSLFGSLLGGGNQQDDGLDMTDMLQMGMSFMQSQQQGDSTLESLADAVMSGSQMAGSEHRSQSGKLVTNTLMQMLKSGLN
jgi:hypothetical protein